MALWSGQTVSTLGSSISSIAFPLLILSLSGSPALAGLAGALRAAPYMLLSLPAGALVDRWNAKRVMIVADVGRALTVGTIPLVWWLGHLSLPQLYLATTIEGTLLVFYDLASFATLPRIVAQTEIAAAFGQNEGSYYAAGLIGPSVSGILYQIGRGLPFLADTVSYILSVVSLLFIKADLSREPAARRQLLRDVLDGLGWMRRQPFFRTMSLLMGGDAFVSAGAGLVVIVLAKQQHASPATIGVIFSIAGIGGVVGAIVSSRAGRAFSFPQVIIGVRWILVGLWPLYAIAPNPLALGLITAVIYLLNPIVNVAGLSYSIPLIPHELLGRVSGVFQIVPSSLAPAGAALAGVALQVLGPTATVVVAAGIVFILAVFVTLSGAIRNPPETAASVESM